MNPARAGVAQEKIGAAHRPGLRDKDTVLAIAESQLIGIVTVVT